MDGRDAGSFDLTLELQDGFRFLVDFGQEEVPPLVVDEPPPVGEGRGPTPARLLAAAVGSCLSASALFCLRKARVPVTGMRTAVGAALVRNESGRLRIGGLRATLHPEVPEEELGRLDRCLELFQDFCVVTETVRAGVDVAVEVEPAPAPGTPGGGTAAPGRGSAGDGTARGDA